jgi:hypothetical protein
MSFYVRILPSTDPQCCKAVGQGPFRDYGEPTLLLHEFQNRIVGVVLIDRLLLSVLVGGAAVVQIDRLLL